MLTHSLRSTPLIRSIDPWANIHTLGGVGVPGEIPGVTDIRRQCIGCGEHRPWYKFQYRYWNRTHVTCLRCRIRKYRGKPLKIASHTSGL